MDTVSINFKRILFFNCFLLTSLVVAGQTNGLICKDNYNKQLVIYSKGQFENINYSLMGCIGEIKNGNNDNYYKYQRRDIVFMVYKICINSHRYLDQEKEAQQKTEELVLYFTKILSRDDVIARLNITALNIIE